MLPKEFSGDYIESYAFAFALQRFVYFLSCVRNTYSISQCISTTFDKRYSQPNSADFN